MSSCFDCGSPVTPEDRFCGNCGLALQPAPRAEGGAARSSTPLTGEPGAFMREGGASEPVGAIHVFRGAGFVLRCPHCDNALATIVRADDRRVWIGFPGIRRLEVVTSQPRSSEPST